MPAIQSYPPRTLVSHLAGALTPAQITSDQNNYNPTGLDTTAILRLSCDIDYRGLTGLASGADGRMVLLLNVGTAILYFYSESTSSTAANRFAFAADDFLLPNHTMMLWYDTTSARWRIKARSQDVYYTPGGSDGDVQFAAGGIFAADAKLNYNDGTDQLTVPGLTVTEDVVLGGVLSPAQITADQNDYSPTGLATASVLRLDSDASRTLTGLASGADGRLLLLQNVGANSIVLADESSSSTAANRFALNGAVTLAADDCAVLQYDATSARWRALARPGAAGGYTHPNHTGDVTSVGDGAQTIAANAATYAKMQDVSAASRLLGRGSAGGAGDPQELTASTGLLVTGTDLAPVYGSSTGTVCQGNDARLSDARTPLAHSHAAGDLPDLDGITPPNASVDFNGQQGLNFRVENRTSDPVSPTTGQVWLRTDL